MLNLVEKFTPAVEADTDDAGLTTVEYAVAAARHHRPLAAAFAFSASAAHDDQDRRPRRRRPA